MTTCNWCGEQYEPTSEDQKYCNLNHARLAKIDRRARKRAGIEDIAHITFPPRECRWCKQTFTPTSASQRYCRKTHARKAQRAHNWLRETDCPRPDKKAHRDESEAVGHLCRLKDKTDLEVYLCRCGKWHLGKRSEYQYRREIRATT